MEKKHPIEDVDIYGEQVREVLSKPPNWLTMTGSSIVFALLLSFLFLSYLIKYPDVLSAKVTITSQTPPANIIAKVNGKIEKIFVTDNSEVVKEQQLAIIENAARLDHVEALKSVLSEIDPSFYNPKEINFSNDFELGDLQSAYSVFTHDYSMLKSHNKINAKNKQVSILRKQLSEYQELIKKQTSQQLNLENEQSIWNKDLERSRKLYTNGVISLRDLEEKQKESLRIKRNIDNLLIEKSNSQIAISNIERTVSDAQSNDGSTVEQLRTKTFESYQNLINQIKTWQQTYILKSPIDGKITYFSFWSENQNIK
jgi:multidrug resistance efflux pump